MRPSLRCWNWPPRCAPAPSAPPWPPTSSASSTTPEAPGDRARHPSGSPGRRRARPAGAGGGIGARGEGTPRGGGDGIAVDISTRVGLVTVEFTGRDYARACPAQRAFTYRGRQYAGSVSLTGSAWQGKALLGL